MGISRVWACQMQAETVWVTHSRPARQEQEHLPAQNGAGACEGIETASRGGLQHQQGRQNERQPSKMRARQPKLSSAKPRSCVPKLPQQLGVYPVLCHTTEPTGFRSCATGGRVSQAVAVRRKLREREGFLRSRRRTGASLRVSGADSGAAKHNFVPPSNCKQGSQFGHSL